MISSNFQYP